MTWPTTTAAAATTSHQGGASPQHTANQKNARRLWLSDIPYFPAKFDAAGEFLPDVPAGGKWIPETMFMLLKFLGGWKWTLKINCICYVDSRRLYCRTPEKWLGGEFPVKWFGFRPESQSYRPKVRVADQKSEIQPGRPRIRTESPRKGPQMGFRCFYRKPPLKPSWIHLMYM